MKFIKDTKSVVFLTIWSFIVPLQKIEIHRALSCNAGREFWYLQQTQSKTEFTAANKRQGWSSSGRQVVTGFNYLEGL